MDSLVRELSGHSVIETLYHEGRTKSEIFDRTLLSHPAIFMVEYALAQTLINAGVIPDLTLGASLGSFVAAAVSGCITAEDALTAAIRQASMLESVCPRGGMLAILAEPTLHNEGPLGSNSEIASYNFATHFVIAAKSHSLDEIETFLRKRNVTFQRLPVSFAFHSRWIDDACAPFERFLDSLATTTASIPLVCCAGVKELNELRSNYLWQVARVPVRFQQTIALLESRGSYRYIDVGPAGTLATFLKYELPRASTSTVHPTLTPFGHDLKNIAAVAASLT